MWIWSQKRNLSCWSTQVLFVDYERPPIVTVSNFVYIHQFLHIFAIVATDVYYFLPHSIQFTCHVMSSRECEMKLKKINCKC